MFFVYIKCSSFVTTLIKMNVDLPYLTFLFLLSIFTYTKVNAWSIHSTYTRLLLNLFFERKKQYYTIMHNSSKHKQIKEMYTSIQIIILLYSKHHKPIQKGKKEIPNVTQKTYTWTTRTYSKLTNTNRKTINISICVSVPIKKSSFSLPLISWH